MANRKARELSGGQQKLLDLVRAAARRPRLFILDEVTAGVHPDLIPTVMEVISDCAQLGAAVLLVTHEMEIARRYCSRLLALHNGQIIADGRPDEVLAHERVVEAYLGS
jgi:branched-chain amino acid transport system ATP-binding protein